MVSRGLKGIPHVSEGCQEDVWKVSGKHLKGVYRVKSRYLEGIKMVSGGYKEGVCNVS